ncbi:DNA-processing protein DprA [Alteromonas gilva]|uniref:DNA-processing protein DprA n=1 Tax=Alteromonas gilva TaxID=2987522 RepID=A0ABT5KWK2_9ALTE|nr:DNA-processing protein DprA [Alteromonas gilva]MDC8829137.1 DNA-processing protein DprA [Alteromonas gilva]
MQNLFTATTQQWCCLSVIHRRTPAFWLALLQNSGLNVNSLFQAGVSELAALGLRPQEINLIKAPQQAINAVEQWLESDPKHTVIDIASEAYPSRLRQLESPPLVLFCRGNTARLHAMQIAIVGSRKATVQGLNTARRLAAELGTSGITVTSGLALGIDGAAHQGAYPTAGGTVAVLGGGLKYLHPRTHTHLAQHIVECEGCLVSEFAPEVSVKPYHFPRRNRVIAALSQGVVLVEAEIKSGSMITANLAAGLDNDVFAVPGNINSRLSAGPHHLIQQGAKLITCSKDIIEEYAWAAEARESNHDGMDAAPDHPLLELVDAELTSVDELAQSSGMPVAKIMAVMLELEISGLVAAVPGGYMRL